MKFNFNDYRGDHVMHCKTEEEAIDFCNYMHENGFSWNNGDSYCNNTEWKTYQENTCYRYNEGFYSELDICLDNMMPILEWSNYMYHKDFTLSDLERGMILEDRQGNFYMWLNSVAMTSNGQKYMSGINEDLTHDSDRNFDIVTVYCSSAYTLDDYFKVDKLITLWKRKEATKMTIAEIEEKLGITNLEIVG